MTHYKSRYEPGGDLYRPPVEPDIPEPDEVDEEKCLVDDETLFFEERLRGWL